MSAWSSLKAGFDGFDWHVPTRGQTLTDTNTLINKSSIAEQAAEVVAWFRASAEHYVVALSGGVDSAVVAKAASLATQVQVVLATGESPSLARQELRDAASMAARIELPHVTIATGETHNRDYRLNDARRCYHCKTHLFEALKREYPGATIVTGTNADDLQDYRPGLEAAAEHQVRAPLAELGFGKSIVRQLAQFWNLPIADKPASPCLASRIAYGVEVTSKRLAMIEQAEQWLRGHGMVEFRVRLHAGELARIEVPIEAISRLASDPLRVELLAQLKSLGFRFVTLDISGFTSGSLNQLIQINR